MMMKSLRWTVTPLLLAASLSMTAQRHTLSAKISGLGKNVTAYLHDVDNPQQTERLDSAKVGSDGSFSLALDLRKPRMCKLSFWLSDKASGKRYNLTTMMLLLDGCADVSLIGDTVRLFGRDPLVAMRIDGGGETLKGWLDYNRYINKQQTISDSVSYAEAYAYIVNNGDESKYADLTVAKEREAARLDSMVTAWIEGHPSTAAAACLLAGRYYKSFAYSEGDMAKWIAEVTKANADTARVGFLNRNRDFVLSRSLGIGFPDFEATTKEGKAVSISSMVGKGKYTLIDFWASWCGPCRAAIPKVKKIFEAHKGELDVVSVSGDQREADWRKAEAQEAMPWPQLWLNKAQLAKAVTAYDISSIPRLVLIGPDGKVLAVTFAPGKIEKALAGSSFTVRSAIHGLTEGAEVRLISVDGHNTLATAKVRDGQFTLTGKVTAPTLCALEIDNRPKPLPQGEFMQDRVVKLYLDNADYTVSSAAFDSIPRSYELGGSAVLGECAYTVKGGKAQSQYQAWHDRVWPAVKAREEARLKAWRYWYGGKEHGGPEHADKATAERFGQVADSLNTVYKRLSDDYAWAHPDESYSLYLQGKNLESHFRYTSEQLGDMAEHFKGNGDAEGYREFAKKIEEAKKTAKGMAYTDITLRSVDGKAVKLSSLVKRGQYTLLDFWASWCSPCRASIPKIKSLHAANPKINIVSISCDRNLADWAKALKEENMPWKQVALPQDKALNRAAIEAYKVQFIPYLVVIDPQGAVIMATSDAMEIMRML